MYLNEFKLNFSQKLKTVYSDKNELENIFNLLLEKRIITYNKHENVIIEPAILEVLQTDLDLLYHHKPIQYIIEEAWFYKYPFFVNEHTLIPRPETEELVFNCIQYIKKNNITSILDIGTGSGCIAISIKKECPDVNVFALDISTKALAVAEKNANALLADITFLAFNILTDNVATLPQIDAIISNPPYIASSEILAMQENVTQHEPHLALFVPDEDPLIFYKKIAAFGIQKQLPIFLEISEFQGIATKSLIETYYKKTQLLQDMQGRDRMIIAFPF